jgi:hypothetical protein
MRPYLAIIIDSFWEALASRVLWILLILITLVLVLLFPLGYRQQRTMEFKQGDFLDPRQLVKDVMSDHRQGDPSPGRAIWNALDEATQERLKAFAAEERDQDVRKYYQGLEKLVDSFNELLEKPDLYTEEDWRNAVLGSEARELLEMEPGTLSLDDGKRLNRILIENAYVDRFRPQPTRQIRITYFGIAISPSIPFSKQRVDRWIEQLAIPMIMGILVGFLAIFAAILVTAPIIPHMFEAGSLNLLLSKPISRSLMFLAKFLGGCAFILLNVTYLIVGLWLIAGLRFSIWNHGLLLCIPIFLFLFAVYYSVSALAGVIWRNAIVSVVLTVVFWLVCTTVGTTKVMFDQLGMEPRRIVKLIQAGDNVISIAENGTSGRWNDEKSEWEPVFEQFPSGPMGHVMGPVYEAEDQVLFASQVWNRGFFRSGAELTVGRAEDGWTPTEGPSLPAGAFELLPDPHGKLLVATSTGLHRMVGDVTAEAEKVKFFFMEIPKTIGQPFRSVGPKKDELAVSAPAAAAVDRQSGDVAIYSRGQVYKLKCDADKKYSLEQSRELDIEKDQGVAMAYGGATILLAVGDGRVMNLNAETLQTRQVYTPEESSQPRFVEVSPDGRWFCIVFQNGTLHLLDTGQQDPSQTMLAEVRGQGNISAAAFPSADEVLVADRVNRVTKYQLADFVPTTTLAPSRTVLEWIYYYAVVPIYTIFPKPGELDNTVQYVLRGEETTDLGIQTEDVRAKRARLNPWGPVASSLAFMVVVLVVSCIYIERQDF